MDGFASLPRVGALFAEDFDLPGSRARARGDRAGVLRRRGCRGARDRHGATGMLLVSQEAAESDAAATRQAIAAIAEQLAAERDAAAIRADQSAEAIARLLLDSLAAAFPALCARYGDAEVRAVVRIVLPATAQEQADHRACASAHRGGTGAGDRAPGSRSRRARSDCRMRRDAAGRRADRLAERQRPRATRRHCGGRWPRCWCRPGC